MERGRPDRNGTASLSFFGYRDQYGGSGWSTAGIKRKI
jgi:hypothetical protein